MFQEHPEASANICPTKYVCKCNGHLHIELSPCAQEQAAQSFIAEIINNSEVLRRGGAVAGGQATGELLHKRWEQSHQTDIMDTGVPGAFPVLQSGAKLPAAKTPW